jgi:hypothetical protein
MGKINKNKLNIDKLKSWFKNEQILYNKDVFDFYKTLESQIKETTVNWRIYSLIQMGILNRIGRGKFILGEGRNFIPEIPDKIKVINNKLRRNFPFLNICLWSTSVFNEFMLHQPGRFYLLVEVEKDAMESVFYFMKESKYSVFLEPTRELFNRYIPNEKETWIVKSLVSEAPTQNVSGINTTTIEKMLVDIFCDPLTFDAQQGSEMKIIFKESFEKYTVNENKMLRYADRRRKKKKLNEYLDKVSKFRQQK